MSKVSELALILFLPWFAILGALYWVYPRTLERSAARRRFDITALLAAFGASLIAGRWGLAIASASIDADPVWSRVLGGLPAFKAFLAMLAAAWAWRGMRIRQG